jgi:phosphoribosylformylglycinamidine synthase
MIVLYVEKKPGFRSDASGVHREIHDILGITDVSAVRLLQRYDVGGWTGELSTRGARAGDVPPGDVPSGDVLTEARRTVLADPVTDVVHDDLVLDPGETAFAWAYHPGQFDQRADSAAQALRLMTGGLEVERSAARRSSFSSATWGSLISHGSANIW